MASKEFALDRDLTLVEQLAEDLGRAVPAGSIERLGRYVELVARWNRTVNLTAARDAAAQVEVLLGDALVLADRDLVPGNARLVDVGSGAGAPAVPLLVLRGDLSAVLVEPRRKRVAFLRTAVGSLALVDAAEVREQRIEPEDPRVAGQPFDVAISRAAFAPERWLAAGSRLATLTLVLTAGAEPPPPPPGLTRGRSRAYRLPRGGAPRMATVYLR